MHLNINKVIKYLIFSDFVFWGAIGLFQPIFAIFVVQNIKGGSALVVGIAASVYWIIKSLMSVPVGLFLDKHLGEKDDYWFLINGGIIASVAPLAFIMCRLPWHIYLVQAVYAVGMAMTISSWQALFTRHIDKGKEATEWSIDATFYGIGTGICGIVGGWAATHFGFVPVFVGVSLLSSMSLILLLSLKDDITSGHFAPKIIFEDLFRHSPNSFIRGFFKRFQ